MNVFLFFFINIVFGVLGYLIESFLIWIVYGAIIYLYTLYNFKLRSYFLEFLKLLILSTYIVFFLKFYIF